MNIYSIYQAICQVNNKCYIGFDKKWPNRQNDHYRHYNNTKHGSYNYKFHKAIREFGWDNFTWTVIYQSLDGEDCLKRMEPYFIDVYDSFWIGYNATLGGDGCLGRKHSPETIEKIRLSNIGKNKGKKFSSEIIEKSKSKRIGQKRSEETKQNISNALKGKKKSPEHIAKLLQNQKGKFKGINNPNYKHGKYTII